MKPFKTTFLVCAAILLLASLSPLAQQPAGVPGGGRGGRGGLFGPPLPPEQQAEVERITTALDAESKAVAVASSNLVAISFGTPIDNVKINQANEELSKVRTAWAKKAAKLIAETQASDKKLSQEAINRLVQMNTGGRGGRGGPPGAGPGVRGGPGGGRPPGGQPF